MRKLTKMERDSYNDDGFVVLNDVFPKEELQRMNEEKEIRLKMYDGLSSSRIRKPPHREEENVNGLF